MKSGRNFSHTDYMHAGRAGMMKYEVLFVSKTGNTEKLALEVYHAIPCKDKDIQRLDSSTKLELADTYFIGFWTNRGTCNFEVMDYISELHGKNIALFGTCGLGNTPAYYNQIASRVTAMIPEDNVCLGTFLCQGKMPMHIRDKYEEAMRNGNHDHIALRMLHNFDAGLLHPNQEDLDDARVFVKKSIERLAINQYLVKGTGGNW
jgi:flavodoxin